MGNTASEIYNGIAIFKALFDFGKISITKARNRVLTPYRVEKLSDDVFSSRINYGEVVTVEGVLSKYSSTYRPITYAPAIPINKDPEREIFSEDKSTGKLKKERGMHVNFQLFQFPIQTLPAIDSEYGKFCVAFLYPNGFNSFILSGDMEKMGRCEQSDRLSIKSDHRPIPVLLPENTLENISEFKVTLTGVISAIPDSLTHSIAKNLCKTRESFYYSFLRPYSRRIGFCIDCRDPRNSDFNSKMSIPSLPAALYTEAHFEGITEGFHTDGLKNIMKDEMLLSLKFDCHPDKTFYVSEKKEVLVVKKQPNIFGFYVETDLMNERDFLNKNRILEKGIRISEYICQDISENYHIDAKFKPDFLYDYKRQHYFHGDGILKSECVDGIIDEHHEVEETVKWLRGE